VKFPRLGYEAPVLLMRGKDVTDFFVGDAGQHDSSIPLNQYFTYGEVILALCTPL